MAAFPRDFPAPDYNLIILPVLETYRTSGTKIMLFIPATTPPWPQPGDLSSWALAGFRGPD
jgi:hypothetical protein